MGPSGVASENILPEICRNVGAGFECLLIDCGTEGLFFMDFDRIGLSVISSLDYTFLTVLCIILKLFLNRLQSQV